MTTRLKLRTHLLNPEDEDCGDADGGHEGVGASIVAGVDAPPVFQSPEHILDFVAFAVEGLIVFDLVVSDLDPAIAL